MENRTSPEDIYSRLKELGDMFENKCYLREAQAVYLTHASDRAMLGYREYIGKLFDCLDEVLNLTDTITYEREHL